MHQTSDLFNSCILGNERVFRVKLGTADGTIQSGVRSILYHASSNPGEFVSIGGTASAYVTITMEQPEISMENQEITLRLGLDTGEGDEFVKLGLFTVQKPQREDGLLTFTAFDRMTSKLNRAYFSNLTYPADGKAVLQEIAEVSGVPVAGLAALPDGIMIDMREVITESGTDDDGNSTTSTTYEKPFNGYTYREALGYVAQLYARFAVINNDGAIELRWYTEVDYTIPAFRYYDDLVTVENSYQIGTIECVVGDAVLTVGSGTTGMQIANPVMTQAHLDRVYEVLKDFKFLPASLSFFGDMRLELGDLVKVSDKKGNILRLPVMDITQDFDGGLLTFAGSVGKTDAESDSGIQKGPTAQALDRVYSELVLAKEFIGNKANFDYVYAIDAEFKTVRADYGEFKTLVAGELSAVAGRFETLDTQFAKIDLANIQQGCITTAMIGTGVIGTSQIADGSITDAKIVGLTANKITAGRIDAAQIEVINLNAANITVGTINGQQIANGTIGLENLTGDLGGKIEKTETDVSQALKDAGIATEKAEAAVKTVQVLYAQGESAKEAPDTGWQEKAPAWSEGMYIWQKTITVHGDGSESESEPTCISGAAGKDGEDATVLRIDSSRGTVFKNNEVSTVLTVVVYHGAKRITNIRELYVEYGTTARLEWSWQRMNDETFGRVVADDPRISDDGFTFVLSPDDVDVKCVFLCDLVID